MHKNLFCVIICFVGLCSFAQSGVLINSYERNNALVSLIGHTDSSLFFLSIKTDENRKSDFYISRRQPMKNSFTFDTSLQIAKLFDGKLDTKAFKYSVFQCKDNLIFVFDVYSGTHKKVIAKVISFTGNVSAAFVLDDSDMSSHELLECSYFYSLTESQELLITLRRKYKSGFQRDKVILYNQYLSKLWDYELPKINYHFDVNVIATVYHSNQLIYQVKNGFLDKGGNEWIIKSDYDTIVRKSIDGLLYNLKVPKDSVCLLIVNPIQNTVSQVRAHWPFAVAPHILPISLSQIILYNVVNIDDEKFILPAKKAIYYSRFDFKRNSVLYENLTLLDKQTQENLTYQVGPGSSRATAKHFNLIVEQTVGGKLFTVFKHNFFEESEIIVSCFDIAYNKFEWVNLLPRKLSTATILTDLAVSYFDKNLNVSFYENKKNFPTPLNSYIHRKHKMVRNREDSHFITFSFDANGIITKTLADPNSEAFLFPWLASTSKNDAPYFFKSFNLLPIKFLYRSQ